MIFIIIIVVAGGHKRNDTKVGNQSMIIINIVNVAMTMAKPYSGVAKGQRGTRVTPWTQKEGVPK